jgi:hypothetical protein
MTGSILKPFFGRTTLPTMGPNEQRKRGDGFEVQQRLAADATNLLHVLDAGDSRD